MKTIARLHNTYVWFYTRDLAVLETYTLAVIEGKPTIEIMEGGNKWFIQTRTDGKVTGTLFADLLENGE